MRILLFTLEIIIYIGSYYLQGDQGEDSDEDIAAMLIRYILCIVIIILYYYYYLLKSLL